MRGIIVLGVLCLIAPRVEAQPEASPPEPESRPAPPDAPVAPAPPAPAPAPPAPAAEPDSEAMPTLDIHGFVSEGAFVSTDNDYIGHSSRGSLELFEAAVNVSTELSDQLRAGIQLFARNVGTLGDDTPRIDWAFLDYRWKQWLGLRAGVIKMPFGLYNEYLDIDAARLPILLPQSVYPLRNRDVLLAHTGAALYGDHELGAAGGLEYQAWLGSLTIPRSALELIGAELDSVDTHYVTGAQLFWQTPLEGLRVGGTVLRAVIDFRLTLDPELIAQLVAVGLVPPDFDGTLVISQDPDTLWVASAEYSRGDWLFAAEYTRSRTHQVSSVPGLLPAEDRESERFYAMASTRLSPRFEAGAYYSVAYADAHDRNGSTSKFAHSWDAFQRDLAATLRLDLTDHWLCKVEGHFIDGAADLPHENGQNADPERYWGLFLIRTTVFF
jgi:hypothetical protein